MARSAPMTPEKVEILNIANAGLISDQPGHLLPPGAWTNGNNIRFGDNAARRFDGDIEVFGAPLFTPYKAFNVPGLSSESFWIYLSLTAAGVYDGSGHTDITRTVGGAYTAAAGRDWCHTLLAGVPLLTNFADVPQWWPSLSVGVDLANLPNWDSNKRCKRIVAFGSYVFALNLIETGVKRPHKVLVSHKADPGSIPSSWDPSDATVDATEFELTDVKSGEIQDALPLGDMLIIYKENATHYVRFIGGAELWKRDLLFVNSGILAPNCVAAFKEGSMHFVALQNDLIVHSGQAGSSQSIVEGTNKQRIFRSLDPENYKNAFCFSHPFKPELWFCYPETGNTYPNRAFVYNYVDKVPTFRDFAGFSIDYGQVQIIPDGSWDADPGTWDTDPDPWEQASRQQIIVADPVASKFYLLDSGLTYHGGVFLAFLERTGLAFEGKHVRFGQRVLIDRVWPKISGTAKWNIQVGMQEMRDGPITWSAAVLFDPQGEVPYVDVDPPANGRLPAFRVDSFDTVPGAVEGYDLRLTPIGEH